MKAHPLSICSSLILLLLFFCVWHIGAWNIGATLILIDYTISRITRFPDDSPIGIITSIIGALFFLALALRQVRHQS